MAQGNPERLFQDDSRDTFLLGLSDVLYSLSDPVQIQAAAARLLGERLGANRAFYAEIIGDEEPVILQDFTRGVASIAGHPAAAILGGEVSASLRRGELVIINDVSTNAHYSAAGARIFQDVDVASCMLAGLVKGGRWTAFFGVHSATPRVWSPFEIDLLQETAERTWSAIERVKLFLVEKKSSLRDLQHRVKNTLQLTASLINLQANEVQDPRIAALFEDTRNRVHSIAAAYDLIHRSPDQATFDMVAYAALLAPELLHTYNMGEKVQFRVEGASATLDLNRATAFGLLLNELASNVCKHAFAAARRGELTIRFSQENHNHILTVAGNGAGLPTQLDYFPAGSLGLRLIHMLAQQLGGDVMPVSGNEVRIQVRFPVTESREECDL